jgi:RNA polymerase sigma-70 factor (ECF subfamily)
VNVLTVVAMGEPDPAVAALRAGDTSALEALYYKYATPLMRFGARLVGSREMASDVVQDVFVSLWERRDRLVIHTTVQAYLYAAVRHRAMEVLRHDRVVIAYERWRTRSPVERAPSPDQEVIQREMTTALRAAIDALPPRAREVTRLRWDDQLSRAEVAEVMGIAVSTVDNHLLAALRALREALRQLDD